ncbi:MAG: nicotinamide riboside transporter PnuC [Porcipelethomonas sp.]
MLKCFKQLSKFELLLWLCSLIAVTSAFMLTPEKDFLSLAASLIGATALIFVAKGLVIGQILTVIFAVFYGIISLFSAYYGEMITYLLMTSPMAISSAVQWHKNPYKNTDVVEIKAVSRKQTAVMVILTAAVTIAFYFILGALNTNNLWFSTVSVATSFLACCLAFLRSPCYALAYAANDIVLIILWTLAAVENISYLPMIICFVIFLVNDAYGFINWKRMQKTQDDFCHNFGGQHEN